MTQSTQMRVVQPAQRLRGELRVPGDKSITHRAYILGAIGSGDSRFHRPGIGADTRATASVISAMGVTHHISHNELVVQGRGLAGLTEPEDVLDCGNSGTTMRLMAGLLAGQPFHSFLTGDASLRGRPMGRVIEPLTDMGADVHGRARDTLAPIALAPSKLSGINHTARIASAQVKSAVLLAALQSEGETSLTQPAVSRDHTERMLRGQGANVISDGSTVICRPDAPLMPLDLDIPGDFSSAAFWLVAAVTHPDADVTIHGVGLNPTRTGLLDVLQAMGADVTIEIDQQDPEPMGTLVARSSELRATNVGGDLIPRLIDEASLFALLAACADGESRLTDATELTAKESNRLQTTALALTALDVGVAEYPEGFVIRGKNHLAGGRVDAAGDHRIAMLAATAGLVADGPITIEGTEATAVSYPGFWDDLESLRA